MRILVTGSRDWADTDSVYTALGAAYASARTGEAVTVVHGACPSGADAMAAAWIREARQAGLPVGEERHPAEGFGSWPACGPRRNRHMVDLGADVCLAFIGVCTSRRCKRTGPHPSHGASGCADLAEAAGIRVRRFLRDGEPGDAA